MRLRVLSASHRDLAELVKEGRFRQDLYYRLNAATVTLPALREREDLGWLIDQFLRRIEKENGETYRIDKAARAILLDHDWPGNLRELFNALRVAAALSDGGKIDPGSLPEHLFAEVATDDALRDDDDLRRALKDCGNNVSALARSLGVNRSTIHRRLKRLN